MTSKVCFQNVMVDRKSSLDFGIEKGTGYGQTISGISSYKSRGKGPKNTPLQKVYDTDDGTAEGNIGRTKKSRGSLAGENSTKQERRHGREGYQRSIRLPDC